MQNETGSDYQFAPASTTGERARDDAEITQWRDMSPRRRCAVVAGAASRIADRAAEFIAACRSDQRTDDVETVSSELIPLCDALAWLGRRGARTLRDRHVGLAGRPLWLWGVRSVVRRRPLGTVLVLGTWNYPLLLPGVQVAQALAAGNRVWLKPSPGCESATALLVAALVDGLVDAGMPPSLLRQLDSSKDAAVDAMAAGVDLVVLTGAASTGRAVMTTAAATLTPSIMELSGVDAVVALPSMADPIAARMVRLIEFGLMFNSGATCIGPRRWMVPRTGDLGRVDELRDRLRAADVVTVHPAARAGIADLIDDAIASGGVDVVGRYDAASLRETGRMAPVMLTGVPTEHAILRGDVFAPVISVLPYHTIDEAAGWINDCPYRLAASVFGDVGTAGAFARRLTVGTVTVNDLVAPTADPRVPFGGRGQSGFGVTRGAEGLLAMTTPQTILTRRGSIVPHLTPRTPSTAALLTGVLQLNHSAGFSKRWAAVRRITTAARNKGAVKPKSASHRPPPDDSLSKTPKSDP